MSDLAIKAEINIKLIGDISRIEDMQNPFEYFEKLKEISIDYSSRPTVAEISVYLNSDQLDQLLEIIKK